MATYTIKRAPGSERVYRIDYRAELNDAQYAAATAVDGPVLVVAGAGSGKTRTLTFRVARLVESGISPHSILL
jgi:DNA helicase-2/ATP-dependent DNA helicase PcrA